MGRIKDKAEDPVTALAGELRQRRLALLKRNQELARETVELEAELRRLDRIQEDLAAQLSSLEDDRVDPEAVRTQIERAVGELDREGGTLRETVQRIFSKGTSIDEQIESLKRLRADHFSAVAEFKAEEGETAEDVRAGQFWQEKGLDELAIEQGVRPISQLEEVLGRGAGLWDSDEDLDEFLRVVNRRRHSREPA